MYASRFFCNAVRALEFGDEGADIFVTNQDDGDEAGNHLEKKTITVSKNPPQKKYKLIGDVPCCVVLR
jgi:hypothetical protein